MAFSILRMKPGLEKSSSADRQGGKAARTQKELFTAQI
jgi:hypothetical protein